MMTTTQIEVRAVAEIDKYISSCKDLESYLFKNDRTPVWDGDIYVYNPTGEDKANHSISNMIRRIPSQVKGHKVDSLSEKGAYSIEVEYIDAYCKDGALIFFYVEICGLKARVFYNLFTISDLQKLKAQASGQKTKTITLTNYLTEENYPAFNDSLVKFANEMPQQGDKNKVVKLDESLNIKGILEEKKKDDAKYASAIIARAQRNEADIKKLKSSQPSGWLDKIIALYRDTITGTEDYFERSEYARWLGSFATFLHHQRLYHLIDNLYDRALAIFRELGDLPDVAMTLNNLAVLHYATTFIEEAEVEYEEALRIRRELAATNPSAYLPDVAMTLNNLAALHSVTNRKEEAEGEYEEVLKLYRKLAATNPNAYLPDVAATLNNLADLHSVTNRKEEAEGGYEEVLKLYRKLAATNPSAYLPDVAMTLNILGCFHMNTNRKKKAEVEYEEALKLYRKLAATNPSAYLPGVATTLNNLGILYAETDRCEEAEKLCQEALGIYREFAELVPSAYQPKVEKTLGIVDWIKQKKSSQ